MKHHLLTMKGRLRYLVESVEGIREDSDRGRLLAILMYWKIFDGIDIPESVMKQILEKGSSPDSLSRVIRFVLDDERRANTKARESKDED